MDLDKLKSEFLSCSICTENYDEKEHTPRLLKCRHYFCESCILKFVKDFRVTCPKCKDEYAVATDDISVFPKENTIRGLRDFLTSEGAAKEIKCHECSGINTSEHYCQDCESFICNDCERLHTAVPCTCNHVVRPIGDVFKEKLAHVQILGAKVDAQLLVLFNHKQYLQTAKTHLFQERDQIVKQLSQLVRNGTIDTKQQSLLETRANELYTDALKKLNETAATTEDRIVRRESAKMNIQLLNDLHGLDFLKRSDVISKALRQSMETSIPENPIEHCVLTLDMKEVAYPRLGPAFQDAVCRCIISAWKSSVEILSVRGRLTEKKIAILHLYNHEGRPGQIQGGHVALNTKVEEPRGKTNEIRNCFSDRPGDIDIVYVPRRYGKHILYLTIRGQSICGGRHSFIVKKDTKSQSWIGTIYRPDLELSLKTQRGEGTLVLSDMDRYDTPNVYFELDVSYTLGQSTTCSIFSPLFQIGISEDYKVSPKKLSPEDICVAFSCEEHDGICLQNIRKVGNNKEKHTYLSANKPGTSKSTRLGVYFSLQTGYTFIIGKENMDVLLSTIFHGRLRYFPTKKNAITIQLRSGEKIKEIPRYLAGFPAILYSATKNASVQMSSNCRSMSKALASEKSVPLHVVAPQLKNYNGGHGAASICISSQRFGQEEIKLMYVVRITISLSRVPPGDVTLFEIGLSHQKQIDNYHSLVCQPNTSMFYGRLCSRHSGFCVSTSRAEDETFHSCQPNVNLQHKVVLNFGFFIDGASLVFKVVDVDKKIPISSVSLAKLDSEDVVPVFGVPLPPSDGETSLTVLNCHSVSPVRRLYKANIILEHESMHQWIQAGARQDNTRSLWTLSLSPVSIERGPRQLQRYQGAIAGYEVTGRSSKVIYFQLQIQFAINETLQDNCMLFQVGFSPRHGVDNKRCLTMQSHTYSFHAASCQDHSSICYYVTSGRQLVDHGQLSTNAAGTKIDKIFKFILSKTDSSVTVMDVEKAGDTGIWAFVPEWQHSTLVFGLYLLPRHGDIAMSLVHSYSCSADDTSKEIYTTDEPADDTVSDSDSEDDFDISLDSTTETKQQIRETMGKATSAKSPAEWKTFQDDSMVSEISTYSAGYSKMDDLDFGGISKIRKAPESTIVATLEDKDDQALLDIIEKNDSQTLSKLLLSMAVSDTRDVYDICITRGRVELSGEVLTHVCRQIQLNEGDNCFQVYPSFKNGQREKPVLVLLERQYTSFHLDLYEGWTLVRRRYDRVSPEATIVVTSTEVQTNLLDNDEIEAIEKAINQSDLPSKHSNITLISGCSYRSRNGGKDLEKCACIVVYCLLKGFIPYLEEPFPESINGIPVDVREGYCVIGMMTPYDIPEINRSQASGNVTEKANTESERNGCSTGTGQDRRSKLNEARRVLPASNQATGVISNQPQKLMPNASGYLPKTGYRSDEINKPLLIGTAVGPIGGYRGTLGGFVVLPDGGMGFLTCAHVAERQNAEIIQPTRVLPNPHHERTYVCGTVENLIYSCGKMDEVGVDAAVIRITEQSRIPNDGDFVTILPEKLTFCGFDALESPKFSEGLIREFTRSRLTREERMMSVIKCGSETGLTRGIFNIKGAYCSSVNPSVINGKQQHVRMHNQFEIHSIKEFTRFSDNGDSGSLVFLPKDSLHCVGMVIGHTNYGSCIVTPIERVLDALKVEFVDFRQEKRDYIVSCETEGAYKTRTPFTVSSFVQPASLGSGMYKTKQQPQDAYTGQASLERSLATLTLASATPITVNTVAHPFHKQVPQSAMSETSFVGQNTGNQNNTTDSSTFPSIMSMGNLRPSDTVTTEFLCTYSAASMQQQTPHGKIGTLDRARPSLRSPVMSQTFQDQTARHVTPGACITTPTSPSLYQHQLSLPGLHGYTPLPSTDPSLPHRQLEDCQPVSSHWTAPTMPYPLLSQHRHHVVPTIQPSASVPLFQEHQHYRWPGPSWYEVPTLGTSQQLPLTSSDATMQGLASGFHFEPGPLGVSQRSNLYKKDVDDCMSEPVVDSLRDSMRSVGAIITVNGIIGTAFRVGSVFVMTAYHVGKKIMDPTQSGCMDVQRLAQACVNFSGDPTQMSQQTFHFVPIVPYANDILDIAVLQLDIQNNPNQFPPPFTLHRNSVVGLNLKTVSLIGYGYPGSSIKHLESSCCMVAKDSKEIYDAKMYANYKRNQYSCYTSESYSSIDRNFNIIINCFMEHGASGSPVISTQHYPHMPVVGVFTHGLPSCFYDLSHQAQSEIPNQYRFEIATDTGYIYYDMVNGNHLLANDLFS